VTKELTIQNDMSLTETSEMFFKSGFFPDVKSTAQAAVKIMAGQELGVGPFASMKGIIIDHGKTELSAGLVGALIKHSQYDYRVKEHTNEACTLEIFENGEPVGDSRFTIQDAQQAGLTKGTNAHSWSHYPRNMLFSRAITNSARWYCPDIFSGAIYTPDELGAQIDGETGEIITVSTEADTPQVMVTPPKQEQEVAKPSRPYNALDAIAQLQKSIRMRKDQGFVYQVAQEREKRRSMAVVNMEKCFDYTPDQTEARHLVGAAITGSESSKDWDDATIATLTNWLNAKPDEQGNWYVDSLATIEAENILDMALDIEGVKQRDEALPAQNVTGSAKLMKE